MENIKKPFVALVELLKANESAQVSDILPQVLDMAKSATSPVANASLKDDDGNVIAIYCFYHKKWEIVGDLAPYGSKKSSKTGLNSMCMEGVNQWTRRNKRYKDAVANVMEAALSDEGQARMKKEKLDMRQFAEVYKAECELIKLEVIPRENGHGYETEEEVLAAYNEQQADQE